MFDIVDYQTGEVYEENQLLANAVIFAAKKGWKVEKIDKDPEDPTVWVKNPEIDIEIEKMRKVREFWQYENGGGQVRR